MLAATKYLNGDRVHSLKNQQLIADFEPNEKLKKNSADDPFLEALINDKFVSTEPTKLNVEKYIMELRKDDRV